MGTAMEMRPVVAHKSSALITVRATTVCSHRGSKCVVSLSIIHCISSNRVHSVEAVSVAAGREAAEEGREAAVAVHAAAEEARVNGLARCAACNRRAASRDRKPRWLSLSRIPLIKQ